MATAPTSNDYAAILDAIRNNLASQQGGASGGSRARGLRDAPSSYASPVPHAANAAQMAQSPYNMQAAYYGTGNTSPVSPYASRYASSPTMQKYIPQAVAEQNGFAIGQRPDLYNAASQQYQAYHGSLTDAQRALNGTTQNNQAFKDSWSPQQKADYEKYMQMRQTYNQSQAPFQFYNPYSGSQAPAPWAPAPTAQPAAQQAPQQGQPQGQRPAFDPTAFMAKLGISPEQVQSVMRRYMNFL